VEAAGPVSDPALLKALPPSAPPVASGPATVAVSASGSDSGDDSNARYTTSSSSGTAGASDGSDASVVGEQKETWWSLLSMHNFTLSSVRVLAACKLVRLSYVPTRPADEQVLQAATDSLAYYQN
jgi:hypothetical protein